MSMYLHMYMNICIYTYAYIALKKINIKVIPHHHCYLTVTTYMNDNETSRSGNRPPVMSQRAPTCRPRSQSKTPARSWSILFLISTNKQQLRRLTKPSNTASVFSRRLQTAGKKKNLFAVSFAPNYILDGNDVIQSRTRHS